MIYISENIRQWRIQAHLSQTELAELISVCHQTIPKWERGESYPDFWSLLTLSQLFKVSLDELIYQRVIF